eukprot:COSAG01_NODE_154_length_23851_cov_159.173999_2_plen_108_part_00
MAARLRVSPPPRHGQAGNWREVVHACDAVLLGPPAAAAAAEAMGLLPPGAPQEEGAGVCAGSRSGGGGGGTITPPCCWRQQSELTRSKAHYRRGMSWRERAGAAFGH